MKSAKPKRIVGPSPKGGTKSGSKAGTATTPSERKDTARQSKRAQGASERREAIIAAGLAEFTAKGFANTRLEDVAKRAGVAKGTIYLHFADKEALFQEMVRTAIVPLASRIGSFALQGGPVRRMMETFADTLAKDVIGTPRGDIVRLVLSEGARFPSLAEFYYREVITHGIAGLRKLIELGIARGEIQNKELLNFPQLVIAPAIAALMWQGLFGKLAPLDVAAMLRVHVDLVFTERRAA